MRALVTIGVAIPCGVVGCIVIGFMALIQQGGPSGDNISVGTASALGGGMGWFAGTIIVWLLTRHWIPPTRAQAWALRAAAVAVVLLGLAVARWVPTLDRAPPVGENPELIPLQAVIRLDTALAALTFLVLAQRNVLRRTVTVAGAVAAVAIVAAAGARFNSLRPLEEAWVNAWWSTQADSFAPDVLSPAPRSCPNNMNSGSWLTPRSSAYYLEGFLPRWLPEDFGLLASSYSGGPGPPMWLQGDYARASALWADGRCREVMLTLAWVRPRSPSPASSVPSGEMVGRWTVAVDAPGPCRNALLGEGKCLEYQARAGEEKGVARILVLQMLGMEREEGDRIALGIPVRSASSK